MITKQEIINNALVAFGNKDFAYGNVDILEEQYKLCTQALLAADFWIFAQVVTDLGLVSDTMEVYNYKYKYLLPADLAKIFSIMHHHAEDRNYQIIGQYLHSMYKPLQCRYVSDNVSNAYPVNFAEAIAYRMAYKLCVAYGSSASQNGLFELAQQSLHEASIKNGQDIPSLLYANNYYTSARFSNGFGCR